MRAHTAKLFAFLTALLLLLPACSAPDPDAGTTSLSWVTWGGYDGFWSLLGESDPGIRIDPVGYAGANYTGYSWAQMRGGDLTDLFSTSQILDGELAKERLLDLSGYDFANSLSTSVLDQVSIDGGVYFLPVSNAIYGILYNKTLMEEHGWQVPSNFAELESLCADIREAGFIPGVIGTQLPGNAFSAVMNLAKTSWLSTPEGLRWEQGFLDGSASAAGAWEDTMAYVQKYIDIGMFSTVPGEPSNLDIIEDYLAGRKAVFFTMAALVDSDTLPNGDKLGMMPYIGEDGSKNVYMYNPTSYIGVNRELAEPGNEAKLEAALQVLSRLYSPEGQASFVSDSTPCVMNVLDNAQLPEGSMVSGAQQAMREGCAFRMTYAGWENVLADMGLAFNDWLLGKDGVDGPACIARMDELQGACLENRDAPYFCECAEDFSLEETALLVGKALGSAAGADAALIPYGTTVQEGGAKLQAGITGKLYRGGISLEVSNSICPGLDGEYAILTMSGAEAKALAQEGFQLVEGGVPYPYALASEGVLEDGGTYRVAFLMQGYSEETGQAYGAQVKTGSIRAFLREWLEEQGSVSPDGSLWGGDLP